MYVHLSRTCRSKHIDYSDFQIPDEVIQRLRKSKSLSFNSFSFHRSFILELFYYPG